MKYQYPHEVFAYVTTLSSFDDRVQYLEANASFAIKSILQCNFSPHIVLDVPAGAPAFKRDTLPGDQTLARIDKAIKVLGDLVLKRGQTPTASLLSIKRQSRFIQLLESVNEKDADIIIAMKDKILTLLFPVIDETLAKAAFPLIFD
jgi:hypothetical protein